MRRLTALPRLRSLQAKLALLLCAIIALAFAVIFFYVVPQLRSNLEEQTLRDMSRSARSTAAVLQSAQGSTISERELNELVRAVADRADARVTILGVQRSGTRATPSNVLLYPISDSRVDPRVDENYDLAARSVRSNRRESGTAPGSSERVAQVAQPLLYQRRADWVALYSRDLTEVSAIVGLISRQVLLAAAVALVVAMAGGFLVARALARRVRRLEAAASELARGHEVEPLPIDAEDELGQLTRTFNDMQERLARADRARREFIANASHELRTPIFSLGGFAELLQDEDLDEATRHEFLGEMREQIERLQKLAVDLLDLSRLDADSLDLHPEPVDLNRVAREVAREFAPAVSRHEAELALDLAEPVEAFGDAARVGQIVRILIDNALRHTPAGARVTVSAERRNGSAHLAVADSGPAQTGAGVDPGSAEQLFERFHTGDAARGSGLGLAIARELAERMDGHVVLCPEPERTVFALDLPAAQDGNGAG